MPERFFGNSGGKGGEAEREERVEIRWEERIEERWEEEIRSETERVNMIVRHKI
jgi:hypothetical protein